VAEHEPTFAAVAAVAAAAADAVVVVAATATGGTWTASSARNCHKASHNVAVADVVAAGVVGPLWPAGCLADSDGMATCSTSGPNAAPSPITSPLREVYRTTDGRALSCSTHI